MRAITVVIAPVVYNAVYDLSTRTPWLPTGTVWYLIALVGGLLLRARAWSFVGCFSAVLFFVLLLS